MKRIASWQSVGKDNTIENCRIKKTETGFLVESVTNGVIDDFATYCAYKIALNEGWETQKFTVYVWIGWEEHTIFFEKDSAGNWQQNGKPTDRFANCIDIDISTTPFTNTIAIDRLQLDVGGQKQIEVIYVNVAKHSIETLAQIYTRLSQNTYRYQNADGSFSAEITVDDDGIVVDYPGLFKKL